MVSLLNRLAGGDRNAWRQRLTRARFFFGYTLAGAQPPRVVFIHVPKTAGITSIRYISKRVGWQRTGRSLHMSEMPWRLPVPATAIEKANRAFFVYGHISHALVAQFDARRPNFCYTFLREPKSRLWSLYKHLNTYLVRLPLQPSDRSYPFMEKCAKLSATEFFGTADPEILAVIDNHTVRQMAGRMIDYPIEEAEWPKLLEQAKTNLAKLDFVGFQETFDADFRELLRRIKIARPRRVPRSNRALSDDLPKPAAAAEQASIETAIERLSRWDRQLYAFALARRAN